MMYTVDIHLIIKMSCSHCMSRIVGGNLHVGPLHYHAYDQISLNMFRLSAEISVTARGQHILTSIKKFLTARKLQP